MQETSSRPCIRPAQQQQGLTLTRQAGEVGGGSPHTACSWLYNLISLSNIKKALNHIHHITTP